MKNDLSIALSGINTLVIFDANAWLDLYTIPPTALEEVINALSVFSEKIWIPNQVYREYSRNAKMKKQETERIFSKAKSESLEALSKFKDIALQKVVTLRNNCNLTDDTLKDSLEEKICDLHNYIDKEYKKIDDEYKKEITVIKDADIVNQLVEDIYIKGKTKDFTTIEKMRICEEGEIRYKYKIAPGYTDNSKPNSALDYFRKYGDLIIWKEILRRVEGKAINIVLVQNEKKQDWYAEREREKLADVLIEEYAEATKYEGSIEVCNLEGFIENYGDVMGLQARTTKELVNILKFEREIYEYIKSKKNEIAYEGIEEHFSDMGSIYDVVYKIGCRSLYGGYFENDEDTEFDDIIVNLCEVNYEKNMGCISIESYFEIYGNTNVKEYIGKDVSHLGNVDFVIKGNQTQTITILREMIGEKVENSYEIVFAHIGYEKISFYYETEFDVIINYD